MNCKQSTSNKPPTSNSVIALPADHTPAPKHSGAIVLSSSQNSINKISNRALASIKTDVKKKRTQSDSGVPEAKKIRLDLGDENNFTDQYDFMREAQKSLNTTGRFLVFIKTYLLFR